MKALLSEFGDEGLEVDLEPGCKLNPLVFDSNCWIRIFLWVRGEVCGDVGLDEGRELGLELEPLVLGYPDSKYWVRTFLLVFGEA